MSRGEASGRATITALQPPLTGWWCGVVWCCPAPARRPRVALFFLRASVRRVASKQARQVGIASAHAHIIARAWVWVWVWVRVWCSVCGWVCALAPLRRQASRHAYGVVSVVHLPLHGIVINDTLIQAWTDRQVVGWADLSLRARVSLGQATAAGPESGRSVRWRQATKMPVNRRGAHSVEQHGTGNLQRRQLGVETCLVCACKTTTTTTTITATSMNNCTAMSFLWEFGQYSADSGEHECMYFLCNVCVSIPQLTYLHVARCHTRVRMGEERRRKDREKRARARASCVLVLSTRDPAVESRYWFFSLSFSGSQQGFHLEKPSRSGLPGRDVCFSRRACIPTWAFRNDALFPFLLQK